MCIEDIAIARQTYTRRTQYPAGTAFKLRADPDRIAVVFGINASVASTTFVYASQADRDANTAFLAIGSSNTAPADGQDEKYSTLHVRRFGAVVQGELVVFNFGSIVAVTEIIMQPALSQAVGRRVNELLRGNPRA